MNSADTLKWAKSFFARHPSMRARDFYKILYQRNFGPAHILNDLTTSKEYLIEEFADAEPECGSLFEPVDSDGLFYWLHLRRAKYHDIELESIWSVLVKTAMGFVGQTDEFRNEWKAIAKYLKESNLDDFEEINSNANSDDLPVLHHSQEFVKAERPSYRIVSAEAVAAGDEKLRNIFFEERKRLLQEDFSETVAICRESQSMGNDVQKDRPMHPVDINRVGISELEYPVTVLDRNSAHQGTVAKITMSVDLPAKWRGTHMSRFLGVLNRFRGEITYVQIRAILETMRNEFDAQTAHFRMEFPYFIEKTAPVSGERGMVNYTAIFDGELDRDGFRFRIGARVPITTLCPCSKELCEKSAHSQRAIVEIDVLSPSFIWIEELIDLAEKAASAPVYSLLKRPDEKFVTEQAYSNPRFVEDVAREIAQRFHSRRDIAEFRVTVTSEESIHNHSAFAVIEGGTGAEAFTNYFSPIDDDAYSTNF